MARKKAASPKKPPEPGRSYEDVADRVLEAIQALEAALKEAYERKDMHVLFGWYEGLPRRFDYEICRVTHMSLLCEITMKHDDKTGWERMEHGITEG